MIRIVILLGLMAATLAVADQPDQAHCAERLNQSIYGVSICTVTLGNDSFIAPFNLKRCTSDSDNGNGLDLLKGVLVSLLAAVSFGSMFIPIKKFDTGDGMYFQWMMAIGAWLVGVIVNYCANQPPLFSLSTLSGIMWATGNTLSIPSFYFVGIGIGQTVQGNLNLLGGWISGSFILCQHIGSVIANYIGVVIVVISTILLAFVKVDTTKQHKSFLCCKFSFFKSRNEEENSLLLDKSTSVNHASIQMSDDKIPPQHADDDANIIVRLKTKPVGKLIGLGLSIASGSLLGFQYLPIELLKKCDDDVFSCHGLPYSFGMFVGILLASTFWFILYCIIMKFNPRINPKLTVPAIISGILFGIGNVSWILSNEFVGLPISFPIITAGASIVSCTWGVLVFREITGWKNLALFLLSFTFIVIGIIIVGISFNNF